MRTLSLERRERILASYDNDEGTRAEMAGRFRVSLGMVKKLLQQRRRIGDIAPRHHFDGRKSMIVGTHQGAAASLAGQKERPHLEGVAGGDGTPVLLASHQRRVGEDGIDI